MQAAVKFALVAVSGTFLAFGTGHLSRKEPGVRVILGTTPEARSLGLSEWAERPWPNSDR